MTGVQNIHCINNHGGVCGVFAAGIAVLLYRINRVCQQYIFPFGGVRARPVAVDALVGYGTVFGKLVKNELYVSGADIVAVNQQCKFFFFHIESQCSFHNLFIYCCSSLVYHNLVLKRIVFPKATVTK